MAKLTIKIEIREFVCKEDEKQRPVIIAVVETEPRNYTKVVRGHCMRFFPKFTYDYLGNGIGDPHFLDWSNYSHVVLPYLFDEMAGTLAELIKAHADDIVAGLRKYPLPKDFYEQFDKIELEVAVRR